MTSIIDDVSFHRSDFYWVWFSPDLHLSYAFLKAFVDLLLLTVSGNSFQARAARNRKDWLRISELFISLLIRRSAENPHKETFF